MYLKIYLEEELYNNKEFFEILMSYPQVCEKGTVIKKGFCNIAFFFQDGVAKRDVTEILEQIISEITTALKLYPDNMCPNCSNRVTWDYPYIYWRFSDSGNYLKGFCFECGSDYLYNARNLKG